MTNLMTTSGLGFVYDTGGREDHYHGGARDCVTRAIAIAAERPYDEVYDALNLRAAHERPRQGRKRSASRTGVKRSTYEPYLFDLGFVWVPTMKIGSGCTVHLRTGEVPEQGHLVVALSRHLTAVIDGVIHDTHDPSRDGTRCVYGLYEQCVR